MSPLLVSFAGWCAALLLGGMHVQARRRLVLVARASHELRGPLSAARLGLGTLAGEPARVAAVDLELARAGQALDDLAAAPSGLRRPDTRRLVDLTALARAYAPSWSTLAEAHGATFRLDLPESTARTDRGPGGRLDSSASPGGAAPRLGRGPGGRLDPSAAPELRPPAAGRLDSSVGPGAAAPRLDRGAARLDSSRVDAPRGAARRRRAGARVWAPDRPRHLHAVDPGPVLVPPSHRWTWRPAAATCVLADPLRIVQAVANLVANAAEHGGGTVRVRVVAHGERVRIEVCDDGPGLSKPVAALVAAARTRTSRRGHGLAVASAIAEHFGGRLAALPASTGARLVLDLPAAR